MPNTQWIVHTIGWVLLCGFGLTLLLALFSKDTSSGAFWGGVFLFGVLALAVRCLLY